ncbi:hypothetical protein GCM10023082_29060 [Streptomyces tremellae]|uniref:Uncharacterized protein n=1 Tax=Streptomyces tremellae TaxID=1124239 RepID=A0ABP7F6S9_9ACTN
MRPTPEMDHPDYVNGMRNPAVDGGNPPLGAHRGGSGAGPRQRVGNLWPLSHL